MTIESQGPQRFLALDALRGICACLVVGLHIQSTGAIAQLPFVRNAWLFVDYFFVLSGFVIAASYGERLRNGFPISRFLFLRLGRLYPLHLAVLLAYLAFELAKPHLGMQNLATTPAFSEPRSASQLIQALTFTNIFGLSAFNGWNPPSWSIAAEFWTYLTMAVLIASCRSRPLLASLSVVALSATLLVLRGDAYLHETFEFSLPRALLGFALGFALFYVRARRDGTSLSRSAASFVEIALVVAVVTYVSLLKDGPWTMLAPFLFVPTVWIFAAQGGVISRLLTTRPMLQLGLLSYSIYLTHQFIVARFCDLAAMLGARGIPIGGTIMVDGTTVKVIGTPTQPWVGDLLTFVALALVIAISVVSYHLVEKPGREWSRKMAKRIWDPKGPSAARLDTGAKMATAHSSERIDR